MGIPSIILHNVINGHAVNLTLDQPIDREITVFFPMVPGKDTITLISDEYLTAKITAEVTNQVNTVVMQKVTDEINNQFATTIMPKIEQSIIDYDQNVTARFNAVNQSIQDLETKVTDITNNAINGLTVKLDQEIIDRKEGDRILEEKIQEIYNIFDSKPNDNIDGTITDMQETMKKLIRISKDTASFLNTNPDYEDNRLLLKPLTAFQSGSLDYFDYKHLNVLGNNGTESDKDCIQKNILEKYNYNENVVINRDKDLSTIVGEINKDIKGLGLAVNRVVPTGTIISIPFNGDKDPEIYRNYLKCDGKEVSVNSYRELAEKLGYNNKDGVFNDNQYIVLPFKKWLSSNTYVSNFVLETSVYIDMYNKVSKKRFMPPRAELFCLCRSNAEMNRIGRLVNNTNGDNFSLSFIKKSQGSSKFPIKLQVLNETLNTNIHNRNLEPGYRICTIVKNNEIQQSYLSYIPGSGLPVIDTYLSSTNVQDTWNLYNNQGNDAVVYGDTVGKTVTLKYNIPVSNNQDVYKFTSIDITPQFYSQIYEADMTEIMLSEVFFTRIYTLLYSDKFSPVGNESALGKVMLTTLNILFSQVLQQDVRNNSWDNKEAFIENIFNINPITTKFTDVIKNNVNTYPIKVKNDDCYIGLNKDGSEGYTVLDKPGMHFIKVSVNNRKHYFAFQKSKEANTNILEDEFADKVLNLFQGFNNQLLISKHGELRDLDLSLTVNKDDFVTVEIISSPNIKLTTYKTNREIKKPVESFSIKKLRDKVSEFLSLANDELDITNTGPTFSMDLDQFVKFYSDHYTNRNDIIKTCFSNYDPWGNSSHYITSNHFSNVSSLKVRVTADGTVNNGGDIYFFYNNGSDRSIRIPYSTFISEIGGNGQPGFHFLMKIVNAKTYDVLEERICFVGKKSNYARPLQDFKVLSKSDVSTVYFSENFVFERTFTTNTDLNIYIFPLNIFLLNQQDLTKPGTVPTHINVAYPNNRLGGLLMYYLYTYNYTFVDQNTNLGSVVFSDKSYSQKFLREDEMVMREFDSLWNDYTSDQSLGLIKLESSNKNTNINYISIDIGNVNMNVRVGTQTETFNPGIPPLPNPSQKFHYFARVRVVDLSGKEIISDNELPTFYYIYNANSSIGSNTSLRVPGAMHFNTNSTTSTVNIFNKTLNLGVKDYKVQVLIISTPDLRKSLYSHSEKFRVPDLRDDFLRYDENNLGSKVDWTIPQIQGSFKIAGTSAGFDNHQGVFQPGSRGTFPSSSTGNAGATAVFDLNNLPSYRKHINSNGKMHPDYTGVQYWIKF